VGSYKSSHKSFPQKGLPPFFRHVYIAWPEHVGGEKGCDGLMLQNWTGVLPAGMRKQNENVS